MNYQLILSGLLELKAGHLEDDSKGICFNLAWKVDAKRGGSAEYFIEECFIHIFGKHVCSPVEGDIVSYLNNKHKWDKETDLGLRRYALLDKMIAYAELKLAEEVA
jgi:hypothetical protein